MDSSKLTLGILKLLWFRFYKWGLHSPTANLISCTVDPSRTILKAILPPRTQDSVQQIWRKSSAIFNLSSINFLGGRGPPNTPIERLKHTHHFRECRERYAKELSLEGEDWSDFALHPVATAPQSMLRTKISQRAVLYCYQNHKGTLERKVLRDVFSPK